MYEIRNAASLDNEKGFFSLFVEDGVFTEPGKQRPDNVIDFHGDIICPGFIDLQVYGSGAVLFSDNPTPASLTAMYESLSAQGTLNFLPTIATNSDDVIYKAINAVKAYINSGKPGVPGLHLEGPFISIEKKGAHIADYIQPASLEKIKSLVAFGKPHIKMITMAPEHAETGVIEFLNEQDIVVAAGHSNTSYAAAQEAFSKGVTVVTHLYNAMTAIHHREPGLAIATMMDKKVMASIVADGIHVDYPMICLAKQMMQERLFLITDAVTNSGGIYAHQFSSDRYVLPDGTLSGSALTMLQAIKNLVNFCRLSPEESIRMATAYPAKAIGLQKKAGHLFAGMQADFLRLSQDLILKSVYVKGRKLPVAS